MDKYIFAITGPTGSGKSTVSNIFRSLGVYVADADKAAKEVTAKGTECLERIRDAFGESVITENGELNRKKLSQIVFNDDKKLKLLNEITHSYIKKRIEAGDYLGTNVDNAGMYDTNYDGMDDMYMAANVIIKLYNGEPTDIYSFNEMVPQLFFN